LNIFNKKPKVLIWLPGLDDIDIIINWYFRILQKCIILFAIISFIIYDLRDILIFRLGEQIKMAEILIKKINKVDKALLNDVKNRIVEAVDPEKIILFGSYAYGKPSKDSDLDILIIMKSNLPRYKRSIPIYKALAGMLIPKDIIVYTPREVEEWDNVPQAFVTTALSRGKKIYEKE
jgi:uncharacterized protein